MRGSARIATYLGRILMLVGFLQILLAWDGAASVDFIQGQFPYLLSGGVPGLALIVIGAGMEYIQAVRQFSAKRARQMAALNVAVAKLVKHGRDNGGLGQPAHGASSPATAPVAAPVPVGVAAPVPAGSAGGAATAADLATQQVVAVRSSFHTPQCHLVTGRDDMAALTRLEAEAQGLAACKVCKP